MAMALYSLSELKEKKFGTYICMPFTKYCHFFHRYDHTNYARWVPVYLAIMKQLPQEVQTKFDKGNWIVKGTSKRFNKVYSDESQDWVTDGTGKRGGGIVGITRMTAALCRWTLSLNLRMHVAALTRKIYHVQDNDEITCNESNPSKKLQDNTDEKKVVELLHQAANDFNVNQQPTVPKRLQNIIPKDVATTSIEGSLLKANSLGQERLVTFLKEGLMMPKDDGHHKKLGDPLPKIYKAPNFLLFVKSNRKRVRSLPQSKPTEISFNASLQRMMLVEV